jgi:hypothetical protein
MTARAIEMLQDPARHAVLREGAVTRAREFSAEKVVPLYERLYEDVLRD